MKEQKKNYTWLKILILIILLITGIILYSRFISTKGLTVKEYKITDSVITDNFHGFKIVHISDIHYGRTVNNKALLKIINEVNLLKPDIVVFTGDLIDKDTILTNTIINELKDNLSNIKVTVGKYAITGEDDANFNEWEIIMKDSGFQVLKDNYTLIYKEGYSPILLAGLSSNTNNPETLIERYQPIEQYLNSDEYLNNIYKILLIHEPDFIDNINYSYFNLILGGHSHNGQIHIPLFGAISTPTHSKKYYGEYYKMEQTHFYISGGLGTSDYSFRFCNKPSINFYRLTNK
ncbi:MAG: hypothetical protein E7173_00010 [Firmicutes bacterium]|nr:hypothetical protein [Bacillota bacterium]